MQNTEPQDATGKLPPCTVIIPTRDRPADLDRCLEAVSRLEYSTFDVLVVNNAPANNATRDVAQKWGVRYLVEPRPGVSRARNSGARACDSEILAYLDDDSVPEPAWLSALVEEFSDPAVMAVTGRTLPVEVTTDAQHLFLSRGGFDLGPNRRSLDQQTPYWFETANFGGIGIAANVAFRRSVFQSWRGFDERIGLGTPLGGGAEPYAFFSLVAMGYRLVYTPRAIMAHPFPRTMASLRRRHLKQMTTTAGYVALLFLEQRRYRTELVQYASRWIRGVPPVWRTQVTGPLPRIAPRWREVLTAAAGPVLCGLSLLLYRISRQQILDGVQHPTRPS
ncbi:MAG: glycosyltransferase [Acidobacteria bacterium]|nr:glycosyltransferase [Acidobacteriota bacterium]